MDERSLALFEKLSSNRKYSDVCPDAVRRVISECEGRYRKPKDLEKAVRERLHGVTSAFNDLGPGAAQAASCISDDESLADMLRRHASTRERLPLSAMDALYARIFKTTGRPESVLDLACGLNPLYLIHRFGCRVVGVDISKSCVDLIPEGIWGDLLCENAIPREPFHIALLFKILPLLERQRAGAAMDVMRAVNAKYLVASFPTRTMGGRNVGMEAHYSEWMEAHLPENRAAAARFATDNDLFYILEED